MHSWYLCALAFLLVAACSPKAHTQAEGPLRSADATVRVVAPGQEASPHVVHYQVVLQGWTAGTRIDSVRDDFGPLEFQMDASNPKEPTLRAFRYINRFVAPVNDPNTNQTAPPAATSDAIPAKAGQALVIAYYTNRTHVLRISTLRQVDGPLAP